MISVTGSGSGASYSNSADIPLSNERTVPFVWARIFRKVFNSLDYLKNKADAIVNSSSELGSTIKEGATTGNHITKSTKLITNNGTTETVYCSSYCWVILNTPSTITISFNGVNLGDTIEFDVPNNASANLQIIAGGTHIGSLGKDYGKSGKLKWLSEQWCWFGTY